MAENESTFTPPAGFHYETAEVEAVGGAVKYPLRVLVSGESEQAGPSLQAWLDHFRSVDPDTDPTVTVARYVDEIQWQRVTQGRKTPVREAFAKPEGTERDEAVAKAVAAHQTAAEKQILGKPAERAGKGPGGLSVKQRTALGTAVAAKMVAKGGMPTQAEMVEIAKSLGIDPALLAQA